MFVPKKRCHVVYNGIDFSKFDKQYDVPDFLKEIDVTKPKIIKMAMVGNFVGVRSQIFLCHVLKQFKNRGIPFCFYFIGKKSDSEPELYDNCVSFCRENGLYDTSVFFIGSRGDVPAILQHVDAFVYSTNRDTFGIAVIEAVAAGLPTIVNDWSVMKEVTDNGKLASLYKTLDVDDCTDKMEEMVVHIEQRKETARFNAEVARLRFSINNHIRNLCELYNRVVGS
jgi:glycosyltransferase involved in cell wall biosynthesis